MTIDQYHAACARFDAANRQDPRRVVFEGTEYPQELLYAERMTRWLGRLAPDASEPLRLAARCQHIRRWEIPRGEYPEGRQGYHQWRTRLYRFHADVAADILREVGYDGATVDRVRQLLMKKHLKTDPEMQLLEDVICIVFLESYFADFAQEHDEEKLLRVVRKTWQKMSPRGREAALELDLPEAERALIERALEERGG